MRETRTKESFRGVSEGARLLAVAAVAIAAVPALTPRALSSQDLVIAAVAAGLVAGTLLLVAALFSYIQVRASPDPRQGWMVAAVVLIAGQVLLNAGLILDPRHDLGVELGWPLLHECVALVVVMGLCLAALRSHATRVPDPLVLGTILVVVAVALRFAALSAEAPLPAVLTQLLTGVAMVEHVLIAAIVVANRHLPRWARWRLAAAIVLIGVGHVGELGGFGGDVGLLASASTMAVAGVLWASGSFVMLGADFDAHKVRASALEDSLLEIESTSRGTRERMHEVQSIVAGLSSATTLLSGPEIPDHVRSRLQRTIRAELSRLERLVTNQAVETSTIDLDEVLWSVVQLHRARGRTVEWQPSGIRIVGRLDDVAEAVNILLENAATHAGNLGIRVAVQADPFEGTVRITVSDRGPGIPENLRSQVFEWGVGRPDSPGQGIGLNLAQRLVSDQGGSITLNPTDTGEGSAFVIRLPAARQSSENHRVGA